MKVFSRHCEQIGVPLPLAPTDFDKKPTVEQAVVPLYASDDPSFPLASQLFSFSLAFNTYDCEPEWACLCFSCLESPDLLEYVFSVFIKFGRL